jgi:uncharacterized protein DUF1566
MKRSIVLSLAAVVASIAAAPVADADAPAGRYVVGDGAVRDVETGLTWSQTEQAGGPWSWADAQSQCPAPWRVPTVQELRTLVDLTQKTAPTIDTSVFYGPTPGSAPSSGWSWTSTRYLLEARGYAFYVSFGNGGVDANDPTQPGSVRCVQ